MAGLRSALEGSDAMQLSEDGRSATRRGMRATILEARQGGWCQACCTPSLTYGWAVIEPATDDGWYLAGASECQSCGVRVIA